jgi:uncharacterized CHY-type Zn-finger protein
MPTPPRFRGIDLDAPIRCAHWHAPLDIVAITMKCCGVYYACKDCHDALAAHALQPWPQSEWDERAMLCGAFGHEMTCANISAALTPVPSAGRRSNPGAGTIITTISR